MVVEVLTFLATNKAIITGATATICEVLIIIHNFRRKIKAEKVVNLKAVDGFTPRTTSTLRKTLWAANPINLFRKP